MKTRSLFKAVLILIASQLLLLWVFWIGEQVFPSIASLGRDRGGSIDWIRESTWLVGMIVFFAVYRPDRQVHGRECRQCPTCNQETTHRPVTGVSSKSTQ